MSRYTGPKWKVARALDYPIFGDESYKRRPTKPGMHGKSSKVRSSSTYATQFIEKQKIKKMYGLSEKQFVRFFSLAQKSHGNVANKLLELLELRLDNIVYRLKLANSRPQARQFVTHGHIVVNGKKASIPSMFLKPGDELKLVNKFIGTDWVSGIMEKNKSQTIPSWLSALDNGGLVKVAPKSDDFEKDLNPQLVVELYSR